MIKPLTSLRFFFAFMVLLNHLPYKYNNIVFSILSNGSVAVSFFFILSGFVLSYNYEKKISEGYNKGKFWVDRFVRIYPIHFIVLFSFIIFQLFSTTDYITLAKQALAHLFLIQNYFPNKEIYSSLNKPAWSICCELLFYFVFPYIVQLIKRNTLLMITILLTFSIALYILNTDDSLYIGINPFIRISDFSVGIIAYNIYKKIKSIFSKINYGYSSLLEFASISFLFLSFYIFSELPYYQTFPFYWLPMVIFILIMSLCKGLISKLLSHHFLLILGEISYSLYMVHFLIIAILTSYFRESFLFTNSISINLFIIVISIFISFFSHKLIEMKLGKLTKVYAYSLFKIKS